MSPSTATATRRPSRSGQSAADRRRRQAARRRRRRACWSRWRRRSSWWPWWSRLPVARKAVNELGLPLHYQDVIRQQAAEKHLDPAFVAAVIYAETKFDARTSSAGAVGLMQILPQTAQFLAHRSGATTFTTLGPRHAAGQHHLRQLLPALPARRVRRQQGAGAGRLQRRRGQRRPLDRGDPRAARQFRIDDIPFPETRAYVSRVLNAQKQYRQTYASQLGYG